MNDCQHATATHRVEGDCVLFRCCACGATWLVERILGWPL